MKRAVQSRSMARSVRTTAVAAGVVVLLGLLGGGKNPADPGRGGFDHVVYGADPGDSLGVSQAATGDFNGDGVMDLLIGAHHADGPSNRRPGGGEAYVFFGPIVPTALDVGGVEGPRPDVILYGQDGESTGASSPKLWWGFADALGEVVTTGDLNGDGFDELVVTAALADGPGNGRPDAGEVYVVFGRPPSAWEALRRAEGQPIAIDVNGTAGLRPDLVLFGAEEADLLLGSSTGDVNGDGFADLLLGAGGADGPGNRRPDAGEAYVVFGRPTERWPDTIDLAGDGADVTFYGLESGDRLRWAVGGPSRAAGGRVRGDLNSDGLIDLALGASHADGVDNQAPEAGEVYVWFGRPVWPKVIDLGERAPNLWVAGRAGDLLGFFSIAFADVTGDGVDDLVIGAPGGSAGSEGFVRTGSGAVYLVFGRAGETAAAERRIDLAAASADVTILGADGGDALGSAVGAGDLNADGFDDLIVGAPYASGEGNLRSAAGEVHVFYGRPSWPATINAADGSDRILQGIDPGDELGAGLLSAGDVDADGVEDLVVGAAGADGPENARADRSGESYVLRGKS